MHRERHKLQPEGRPTKLAEGSRLPDSHHSDQDISPMYGWKTHCAATSADPMQKNEVKVDGGEGGKQWQ